ncbi:tetraspanin-18-like [Anthonomus grandis grandis]|uniref:tetraspanin-18-like n=1 Tax=Anthonomus grandis grandis TaxID=2921223 RepID=UPI0021661222|nr:tetraspanin-18-like [Anthonomus grandis grandis]
MTYDCGSCIVKYILCGFNFAVFLAGGALLAIGIWLLMDMSAFITVLQFVPETNYTENFTSPAFLQSALYAMMAIGGITIMLSFLGYCGALSESNIMLTLYGILLILILALEITAGVLAAVYKNQVEDQTKTVLTEFVQDHYVTPDAKNPVSMSWDAIQISLKCCGVNGYQDFAENESINNSTNGWRIPSSCCALSLDGKPLDSGCMSNPTDSNSYYQIGCYNKVKDLILVNMNIVIVAAATLAGVEIIGVIFAFCLANSINKAKLGY